MGIEKTLDGMCIGEKRKAVIPPHYGYGENAEGAQKMHNSKS